MDTLGPDKASGRQKMLAAGYAVSRTNGMVRFVAHASRGPGRTARFASGILVILGVVSTGFWALAYLAWSLLRPHDPGVDPPEWVRWLFPGGLFLLLAGLAFAAAVKLWAHRNVPKIACPAGTPGHVRRRTKLPDGTTSPSLPGPTIWAHSYDRRPALSGSAPSSLNNTKSPTRNTRVVSGLTEHATVGNLR